MAAADRLSVLPDDVLRHVLRFAPAKEAASTAVLSRRWRSLWPTSGAVNLDSRSYYRAHGRRFTFAKREAFFHGAGAALAAAHAHGAAVTKLTFHVETDDEHEIDLFLHHRSLDYHSEHDMIAAVLSHPAARRVEELRVRAGAATAPYHCRAFYALAVAALPSAALRALHLANCADLAAAPPGAAAFPRLEELKLQGCKTSRTCLQAMIDGAPLLATLHLENTFLRGALDIREERDGGGYQWVKLHRLSGPAITALVLVKCGWPEYPEDIVELEMPMLRYFRYGGPVHGRFSLKSQVPKMSQVDLHFVDDGIGPEKMRLLFWEFIWKFNHARALKLELEFPIHRITVADKDQDELLECSMFYNLEHLELEGCYEPASERMAVAIANLLHCCPVVCDLQLRFGKEPVPEWLASKVRPFVERKTQLDYQKSIDHFRRRRRPMILLGGDDDDNTKVSDIPGLSDRSFSCLQNHLRRLSLKFGLEDPNCFGVQLTKFFAENALVLEEIYIDNGNLKMCEHTNRKVKRWIANSSKRRDSPSAAGFAVLPNEM